MHKSNVRTFVFLVFILVGCKQQGKEQTGTVEGDREIVVVNTTLFDKELEEIKMSLQGRWQLLGGKNSTMEFEFEDTFIEFNGDQYAWTDEEGTETGLLNWRREDSGMGYDTYLMDVFYEENPSFPMFIKSDTLVIQDCSENYFKYRLVRK